MNTLPSPSELERVALCMASEVLPHSRDVAGQAARKGTVIHAFLQRCLEAGRDAALAEADEQDVAMLHCIEVSSLPAAAPGSFNAEVSFAYNPETEECRVLGMGLERDEARALARPGEMVGTVDVVGIEQGEAGPRALVWDYKTGRGHVTKASANWQVWTYLLMVCRAFGLTRAKGGIIRTNETGTWFDVCEMDELDLAMHAARLRELLGARAAARADLERSRVELEPYQGPHCHYCPAAMRCPPRVAAVLALAEGSTMGAVTHFELTREKAAAAWVKLKNAQLTLDRMKAMVVEFARTEALDLGDGFVLGERQRVTESIVAERARKVLAETYGELGPVVFGAAAKTEASLTKDALRKALARFIVPTKPGAKVTWEMNAALKALRAAGAMSVRESTTVDEHRSIDSGEAPLVAVG